LLRVFGPSGVLKSESNDFLQAESGAYLAFDEPEEVVLNV